MAHAEHAGASVLYRWDGDQLRPHQTLAPAAGRAFATFSDGGTTYLVVACISAPTGSCAGTANGSQTCRRSTDSVRANSRSCAPSGHLLVVRINFILGTPADARPVLDSQVYAWEGGALREVARFPTCGGTDVAVLGDGRAASSWSCPTRSRRSCASRPRPSATPCPCHPAEPPMPPSESAELVELFTAYTGGPASIGAHLAETVARDTAADPLIVATGTDVALFPGEAQLRPSRPTGCPPGGSRNWPRCPTSARRWPAWPGCARPTRPAAGGPTLIACCTRAGPRGRPARLDCGGTRSRCARSPAGNGRSPRWSTTAAG